jgi:hypothetical protein
VKTVEGTKTTLETKLSESLNGSEFEASESEPTRPGDGPLLLLATAAFNDVKAFDGVKESVGEKTIVV